MHCLHLECGDEEVGGVLESGVGGRTESLTADEGLRQLLLSGGLQLLSTAGFVLIVQVNLTAVDKRVYKGAVLLGLQRRIGIRGTEYALAYDGLCVRGDSFTVARALSTSEAPGFGVVCSEGVAVVQIKQNIGGDKTSRARLSVGLAAEVNLVDPGHSLDGVHLQLHQPECLTIRVLNLLALVIGLLDFLFQVFILL